MSRLLVLALLAAAGPAAAYERLGVLSVAEPPGPDADLAELTHQLRAACRDRVGGVEEVPTMRARLLGQRSNATLTELERAYGGALAVYQSGEFESAIRTLKAIVEDLESLPESEESYAQWVRAQLRLAHAALTIGREREADEAMTAVARTDLAIHPETDLYSPAYRRRFEAARARVRALPARRLQVLAEGAQGTVYVNGRVLGRTPLTVTLPAGTYRVGGAAGALHVPSFRVDLSAEERTVVLDFALADALRVGAGPGLALPAARRAEGLIHAGAWLGVDRVIAVARAREGDALFLLGSIYDVRNGALLREGSVRMVAGSVPAANLAALAGFLLTGQSSRDVKDRTEAARAAPVAVAPPAPPPVAPPAPRAAAAVPLPPAPLAAAPKSKAKAPDLSVPREFAPPSPPAIAATPTPAPDPAPAGPHLAAAPASGGWMRPAAYASTLLAGAFTALAIHQGLAARDATADADRMVGADGVLGPGHDPARYQALRRDASSASRNAWLSGGAAVGCAAAAAVLGWRSRLAPGPDGTLALAVVY